jgi:hypothetical protein
VEGRADAGDYSGGREIYFHGGGHVLLQAAFDER